MSAPRDHAASTGFVHHPRCLEHEGEAGHPEQPARLAAILAGLRESGLLEELDVREAEPAGVPQLERVHTSEHVARVEQAARAAPTHLDGDTYVAPASYDAARLAAGGLLEACANVARGQWRNAFVAVRPPGHHAETTHAMGFCLFNNVAVAARAIQREHDLARVAVVDWDVHHGNGTQHIFERDPSVFYASVHQYPHYPGTGAASERGRADGEGATLNCPLPAGSGEGEWTAAIEQIARALEQFRPDFLLVSAGFDAHEHDPLSGTLVPTEAYGRFTEVLTQCAREQCDGRLVSVLEGGYHLDALAASVGAHVAHLRGSG